MEPNETKEAWTTVATQVALTILKKYLKHIAIVISLGGGAYATIELNEGEFTIDVDTEEQTAK